MKGKLILLLLCAALASAKNTKSWSQISRESPIVANPPSSGLSDVNSPSGGPTVVDIPRDEPTVVDTPLDEPTIVDTPAEVEEEVEGYESQIFPHENCNQFYLIAEGISEVLTCPAFLLYNPDTKRCDWPHKVECGDRIVPEPIEEEEEESAVDDEEESSSGVTVVDTNSSDEEESSSGVTVVDTNSSEDNIVPPRPPPPPPSGSECRYNGQILPNENCNQFNLCAHGVPVAMSCPGDLLFNLNKNVCDWPNKVDCGDRVIPEAEESEAVADNDEAEKVDEETPQVTEHDNGIFVIG